MVFTFATLKNSQNDRLWGETEKTK